MLGVLKGASSIGFLAPGLVFAMLALWKARSASGGHRAACLAGLLLLVMGLAVYSPLDAVSGRYSIPAVWGLDLGFAVLLSLLATVPAGLWKRLAVVGLACGLAAVAVANLGKQDKFAARAALLWQALEHVERQAPPGACLGWLAGPDLNIEEGIHFGWHLSHRGRPDLDLCLLDAQGRPQQRPELDQASREPVLLVSGSETPPGPGWQRHRDFASFYWGGRRRYHCYLYQAVVNQ